MGPPWDTFCQITLTSCLKTPRLWDRSADVDETRHVYVYSVCLGSQLSGSGILNFRPCAVANLARSIEQVTNNEYVKKQWIFTDAKETATFRFGRKILANKIVNFGCCTMQGHPEHSLFGTDDPPRAYSVIQFLLIVIVLRYNLRTVVKYSMWIGWK